MNWEAISAIGQLVGALAVVISLIYLAREIRSNAREARLASMDTVNRWLGQLVVHADLNELYYRGVQNFQSLERADLVRFSSLMDQLFDIYEEIYYSGWRGIWSHACGVTSKRLCATSTLILAFRLGGVHAHIGSMRTS